MYHYINFFGVPINKKITTSYDNQVCEQKFTWTLQYPYHQRNLHNETESQDLRIILTVIPAQYKILHVYGHQDNKQKYELLPTQAKLNIN